MSRRAHDKFKPWRKKCWKQSFTEVEGFASPVIQKRTSGQLEWKVSPVVCAKLALNTELRASLRCHLWTVTDCDCANRRELNERRGACREGWCLCLIACQKWRKCLFHFKNEPWIQKGQERTFFFPPTCLSLPLPFSWPCGPIFSLKPILFAHQTLQLTTGHGRISPYFLGWFSAILVKATQGMTHTR